MDKEKLEAVKQWSHDPCGAAYAGDYPEGSAEFFAAVRRYRYEVYAPWLKKLLDGLYVRGKKVLEVGCGMGNDLLTLAQNGADVTGIDLVPKHVALARRLFDVYGCSAGVMEMDAELLNFPPESFDLVYSFGVLHHTPHIEKAVAEIYRVLRPGGAAVIGLYHKNSWHYRVNLFFYQGLLKGKLFRMNMDELLSTSVEFSRSGAKPLVRVYSAVECRHLFRSFSRLRIRRYHWQNSQLPFLGRLPPFFLPGFLGWYMFCFAEKKGECNKN